MNRHMHGYCAGTGSRCCGWVSVTASAHAVADVPAVVVIHSVACVPVVPFLLLVSQVLLVSCS